MTHCDRCGGEYKHMLKTRTAEFNGGILTVSDFPVKQCSCGETSSLSDGVLVDGYKMLLERNGVVGKVAVSLRMLKERYPRPMDLIMPYVES